MTNAEAIKIINQYDCNFYWTDGEKIPTEDLIEAFYLAVKALEAQEPRVLTLEEVIKHYSLPPVFVDDLSAQEDYLQDISPLYFDFPQCDSWAVHWRGYQSARKCLDDWKASYGINWRCWSAKPTEEQREATPWTE